MVYLFLVSVAEITGIAVWYISLYYDISISSFFFAFSTDCLEFIFSLIYTSSYKKFSSIISFQDKKFSLIIFYDDIYYISFDYFFVFLWCFLSFSPNFCCYTLYNWQIIFLCKGKISFIMGRDCHNSAGSISSENIVSYSDRDLLVVEWVDGVSSCENSCFVFVEVCSLEFAFTLSLFDIFFYCFTLVGCCNFGQQRMFRSESNIRHSIHCVDACRIHGDCIIRLI